jgi:hypothetical protein
MYETWSVAPLGLIRSYLPTHGLRRGLHSFRFAAPQSCLIGNSHGCDMRHTVAFRKH